MQQGPSPKSSSQPKPELSLEDPVFKEFIVTEYPLNYINKLLLLVNELIDVTEDQLLKIKASNAAVNYFHNLFFDRLKYGSSLETDVTSKEFKVLTREVKISLENIAHLCNLNHFLGELMKNAFDKGVFFNTFDYRFISCHDTFIDQLIDIAKQPLPELTEEARKHKIYNFHNIDRSRLMDSLSTFIGQLAQFHPEAAQALHNFMHVTTRITKTGGSMSIPQLAVVVAPCLRTVLVHERLFNDDSTASKRWGQDDSELYETGLMVRLFHSAAETNFFDAPFNLQHYKDLYQPKYGSNILLLGRKCHKLSPAPCPISELSCTGVTTATHCLDETAKAAGENEAEKDSEKESHEKPLTLSERIRRLSISHSKGGPELVHQQAAVESRTVNPLLALRPAPSLLHSYHGTTTHEDKQRKKAQNKATEPTPPTSPRRKKSSQGQ